MCPGANMQSLAWASCHKASRPAQTSLPCTAYTPQWSLDQPVAPLVLSVASARLSNACQAVSLKHHDFARVVTLIPAKGDLLSGTHLAV